MIEGKRFKVKRQKKFDAKEWGGACEKGQGVTKLVVLA